MDIVSLSQGNFFLYKALSQSDWRTQRSLLVKVIFVLLFWERRGEQEGYLHPHFEKINLSFPLIYFFPLISLKKIGD